MSENGIVMTGGDTPTPQEWPELAAFLAGHEQRFEAAMARGPLPDDRPELERRLAAYRTAAKPPAKPPKPINDEPVKNPPVPLRPLPRPPAPPQKPTGKQI